MNCCDYQCNQGRDCPARACTHCRGLGYDASGYPCTCTKVAKIGQRMPGPDLLPPSPWRRQLRILAYWMLMAIAGVLWLGFLTVVIRA